MEDTVSNPESAKRLTLLWQDTNCALREWILEIFGALIEGEVFDGEHQIVLSDCLIVDTHLHRVDPTYYPRFRCRNAFMLRLPDEYFRDINGIYRNFSGVFRMHYSGVFRRERVMPVPLGYSNGVGHQKTWAAASQRKYIWAMLGQMNKSTRPDAVTAFLPLQPHFWYASDGWTPGAATAGGNSSQGRTEEYGALLASSAFCPAPMGNVQQETNRPFEALESGSIPLLERRWLMDVHRHLLGPHPLPTFSSWTKAAAFAQAMWADPQGLDQLQAECTNWWTAYKRRLSEEAQEFVERLWRSEPAENSEFMRWWGHIPGWSLFELLRHHSPQAVRRRIVRQTRRLVEQGRLTERI